ncbi:hypothetical protein [Metabacillus fastidiosus]|uniref:Uncharacterized protein n=1 Tax=Metabacillus fastidiosus TaxID=1458 RepID=A0ABU6NVE1_9BACI|nr:hypothetical protein [Metabacillus fastidiosus]MED4401105.1 hypothetical protein [Metabacillus fastidiosus]MED4453318.1 hypothetical protein [Metabacillus fastidiosus]MED4464032.1 hypothetical protein [Metabacillus fastidiosus]
MRRRYNRYTLPSWLKQIREVGVQIIVPLSVFQAVRTVIFPTSFDVLLLAILIGLALALHYEWI